MDEQGSASPPWMPSGELDGAPRWDEEEAQGLVGLQVLIGVTHVAADGKTVTSQAQYHGQIVSVDEIKGFEIACKGKLEGKTMTLPPVLQAFHAARPGIYRLRSTGEEIQDPDLTSSWTVTQPSKS